MRIIIKILLFPLSLVLSVFVAFSCFLIGSVALILDKISGLVFFGAIILYLHYFFGFPFGLAGRPMELASAISLTVVAFLISPFGIPAVALWCIDKIDNLNDAIRSI